jgi:hypothetical protein
MSDFTTAIYTHLDFVSNGIYQLGGISLNDQPIVDFKTHEAEFYGEGIVHRHYKDWPYYSRTVGDSNAYAMPSEVYQTTNEWYAGVNGWHSYIGIHDNGYHAFFDLEINGHLNQSNQVYHGPTYSEHYVYSDWNNFTPYYESVIDSGLNPNFYQGIFNAGKASQFYADTDYAELYVYDNSISGLFNYGSIWLNKETHGGQDLITTVIGGETIILYNSGERTYADHTAADADDTLPAQAIYKLTGDSTIYQKDGNNPTQIIVSSAIVTPLQSNNFVAINAQTEALTLDNPTGTWREGQELVMRIKDNGTSRAITFGNLYRAVGVTLPTTTTANKVMYLGIMYNTLDNKFDVIGISIQA